jgi:dCTP deaminase
MTILSAQSIRRLKPIEPFFEKTVFEGCSFGLSACGYDVRIDQDLMLRPGDFVLASTVEHFNIANNVMARVADKSTWARKGIAVQNTIIEPNWRGYLTLEITNHGLNTVRIKKGTGIAQILFEWLDEPTELPYVGKYQDQKSGPQEAIMEQS